MRNKKIRITGLLMVLAALLLSVTFGQAPPSSQEQIALQIISQRFGIPINELAAINKVTPGEEGIIRIKVLHIPQVKIYIVNLDAQNREVDDATMQQILAARRGQGFVGKQQRALYNAVRTGNPTELIKVGIWLKQTPNPPRLDRDAPPSVRQAQLEVIRNYHAALRRPIEEFVARNQGRVLYGSQFAPLLFAEVSKSFLLSAQTSSLEVRPDVEVLYLSRQYRPALDHSTSAINADEFWDVGITGAGIKTAVIEIDGIDYNHPNLQYGSYCKPDQVVLDWHPTMVAGVIASTHAVYKGVAYGAPGVLSGNAESLDDSEYIRCTDWAIEQGATVINYSVSLYNWGNLEALDHYTDYVVRHNYVTIVASAGNLGTSYPYNVTSPGLGFNVLSVGAYDDTGDATPFDPAWDNDFMWQGSSWQDPISDHNDREKPELAAPGANITSTDRGNGFKTESGTSFSAPHVVGAAALLMQKKPVLTSWPEEVRAVLMASAIHNIEGDTRLSEYDGAGGLDLASALGVLDHNWSDHGTFTREQLPYSIHFAANTGERVRFAIAWDSNPAVGPPWDPSSDPLRADLDIIIYAGGSPFTYSASYDNSYEIVDFVAPFIGVYTAQITYSRFQADYEFVGWSRLVVGTSSGTEALFRIERATGNVYTDGSFYAGGADLAEHIFASEPVEAGDVVELDPHNPRQYRKARGRYSPSVAGVISTHPGVVLGAHDGSVERPLLALMGRAPVKATTENGPIRPGDLLTSSSKLGYAMRCDSIAKCEGAIVGKALEALEKGEGVMLVMR
jgi:subtilisin family serine protease